MKGILHEVAQCCTSIFIQENKVKLEVAGVCALNTGTLCKMLTVVSCRILELVLLYNVRIASRSFANACTWYSRLLVYDKLFQAAERKEWCVALQYLRTELAPLRVNLARY